MYLSVFWVIKKHISQLNFSSYDLWCIIQNKKKLNIKNYSQQIINESLHNKKNKGLYEIICKIKGDNRCHPISSYVKFVLSYIEEDAIFVKW